MNIWTADKIMKRLNAMLEHAMAGVAIETSYFETKMSALESKMTKYIAMNQLGKQQLQQGRFLLRCLSKLLKTAVITAVSGVI